MTIKTINIKEMSTEDLEALRAEVTKELRARKNKEAKKVIVDLPTFDKRHKNWIKHVTRVNAEKSNGYAFEGNFIRPGSTVELPEGSILLYYYGDGSVKNHTIEVEVHKITLEGLEDTGIGTSRDNRQTGGWALDIRDQVAELF